MTQPGWSAWSTPDPGHVAGAAGSHPAGSEAGPPAGAATGPPEDGRHLAGVQLGPVGVAAIVAAILILFGIGSLIVPAIFAFDGGNRPAATGADDGARVETSVESGAAPTAEPSATPTVLASASTNPRFEERVVELVNRERAQARPRCEPVRMDPKLRAAARAHSVDMAVQNYFSHTGKDGSTPAQRMSHAGYPDGMSENIAMGQSSPDAVMRTWTRSDEYQANIVDCDAKAIGVGVAYRGRTAYWTQNFGSR